MPGVALVLEVADDGAAWSRFVQWILFRHSRRSRWLNDSMLPLFCGVPEDARQVNPARVQCLQCGK